MQGLRCRKEILALLDEQISQRRQEASNCLADALGHLLASEDSEGLKPEEIKDALLEMLFAGVTTTARSVKVGAGFIEPIIMGREFCYRHAVNKK